MDLIKFKYCEIIKKIEKYKRAHYQMYHEKGDEWYSNETRDIFLVNGPGFRNRKFDSLDEAKRAINIRQRKIDTSFKELKKDISSIKKKIKVLSELIEQKEKWMQGY